MKKAALLILFVTTLATLTFAQSVEPVIAHTSCVSPGYTVNINDSKYNAKATAVILAPPTGCAWKVTELSASLATYGNPNAIGQVQVVGGDCTATQVLWVNSLAVDGTQTQSDHITQSSMNLNANVGSHVCIEFTAAITNAYETVNMTIQAF